MNLAHALKWSLLGELATKLVQPLVFVALARLLAPQDFGVMASALMVIGLSQVLWDAGMAKALVQRQERVPEAADVAFWTNMVLGVLVAAIVALAAGPIALVVFQDPRVAPVLRVMAVVLLLGACCSVHTALLQKEMRFEKLFRVRFATVALPSLASIPLAWAGMGYWALVAGSIVGQAAQAVLLWRLSGWRPRRQFDVPLAAEMGRFAGWVTASGFLSWSFIWLDAFVVGLYLGSHHLGLYRTGSQFTEMVFAILFAPIAPVLYSHLSRMHQDRQRIAAAAQKVLKTAVLVAIPAGLILSSVAQPLSSALFGPRWNGVALVIGAMALSHSLAWVVGLNGEFYRALGKPSRETAVNAILLPVYLLAYVISIQRGFETFVWTRYGLVICAVLFHLVVLRAVLGIRLLPLLAFMAVLAAFSGACSFAMAWAVRQAVEVDWLQAGVAALASAALIGAALAWTQRDFVRELVAVAQVPKVPAP